jgi:hypothetical protein
LLTGFLIEKMDIYDLPQINFGDESLKQKPSLNSFVEIIVG